MRHNFDDVLKESLDRSSPFHLESLGFRVGLWAKRRKKSSWVY